VHGSHRVMLVRTCSANRHGFGCVNETERHDGQLVKKELKCDPAMNSWRIVQPEKPVRLRASVRNAQKSFSGQLFRM
jgi:hypothetical protein